MTRKEKSELLRDIEKLSEAADGLAQCLVAIRKHEIYSLHEVECMVLRLERIARSAQEKLND